MRAVRVIQNGGWYNRFGEWIGWGDLSPDDFRNIAAGLIGDERFIVLRESDMCDPISSFALVDACRFLIVRHRMFAVVHNEYRGETCEVGDFRLDALRRSAVNGYITC
jgi:hypothetical protein